MRDQKWATLRLHSTGASRDATPDINRKFIVQTIEYQIILKSDSLDPDKPCPEEI